jgi:flagellar motility protein MotE (MotC chaperone)
LQDLTVQTAFSTNLVLDHLVSEENQHIATCKAKDDERAEAAEREKQAALDKAAEKQRRKEAKEAEKRRQELEKLKEEIKGKFLDNGGQSATVPDIMA